MRLLVFAAVLETTLLSVTLGYELQEISIDRVNIGSLRSSGNPELLPHKRLSLESLATLANAGPHTGFRFDGGLVLKSPKGIKRVRLMQTYAGYDVYGAGVEAEMDSDEHFSGHMFGDIAWQLHKHIPNPESCQQSVKVLLRKAFKLQRLSAMDPHIGKEDGRRLIFAGPDITKPRLAYKVDFFYRNGSDIRYPVYFFDACNSNVLLTYDQLMSMRPRSASSQLNARKTRNITSTYPKVLAECDVSCAGEGGNEKIGKVEYNTSPYCLNVRVELTNCIFEGTYTKAVDNEQTTTRDKTTTVSAVCSEGYSDPVNGAYGIANDAFFHGEIFGSYFETEFSMTILDYTPRLVVHYDANLENAYADGTDTYYGDGADVFHPLISLDIVAHELAHLITARNSNLVYRGMSGGMNEAFSDITAAAIVTKYTGTEHWWIGSDVTKDRDALRYMDDPPKDGHSIKHILAYRPFVMGVHTSSGLYNHAFYLMVTEEGLDINDAYKCFLDANLQLWRPFANFFTGACRVVQAAYDNGFEHSSVRSAFRSVGLPLIFCNAAALTTSMYPGETREGVLVRAKRSPIIKIEPDHTRSNFTVKVMAEDKSQVQVIVGKDHDVTNVIAKGSDTVRVDNPSSPVYVKLMSDARKDVSIKMAVV